MNGIAQAIGAAAQRGRATAIAITRETLAATRAAVAAVLHLDTTPTPRTKTVRIRWVEECHHEVVVRVVADFYPDNRDIANGLALLKDDGYQWLTREQIDIDDADDDPAAEFFDPPTLDED